MSEIVPADNLVITSTNSYKRKGPLPKTRTGLRHTADGLLHNKDQDHFSDGNAVHTTPKDDEVASANMRRTRSYHPTQNADGETTNGTQEHKEMAAPPKLLTKRSHTVNSTIQKNNSPAEGLSGPAVTSPTESGPEAKHNTETDNDAVPKEKKKGVSFLSRFIGNKKKGPSDEDEHESSAGRSDTRPEGMDANIYSQPVDTSSTFGFTPRHPQPPPYIKVRSKYKKEKEFDHVFLAQELRSGSAATGLKKSATIGSSTGTPSHADEEDTIWALDFSKDGRYLATGGQDKTVRVWAVISTPEERRQHEREEQLKRHGQGDLPFRMSAAVFQSSAYREYKGHEGAVIALSWSKNNFLLSASGDKTVRLWHVSRAECLCTFKHTEHVLSVQFHPRDDRFFLAGSRDMKLRLWSIPDKGVAFWKQCPEIITAVSFTPDGKTAIAGTVNGICLFYETEGLKFQTQMHVRSAHGKNAKGSKISSIQTLNVPSEKDGGEVKLLISSNDSRIRLYNLRDKSLEIKFKGHKSEERSIHATFSDDARYIVSGSEDKGAYIYSTCAPESEKPNQRPVEFFEASTSKTTWVVLSPTKTRLLLSQSEDPIYEVCNPPPVTLLSRSESVASSRAPTESGSVQAPAEPSIKKATESAAYLARSAHQDGQIIVTASNTGIMRVYRQDCAFTKRKTSDNWDASSVFSKKASSIYMARAMSRSSPGGRTGRSDSTGTQPPQDRILSWRQAISSTQSLDRPALRHASDAKSSRSISPTKSSLHIQRNNSINPPQRLNSETPSHMPRIIASDPELTESPTSAGAMDSSHLAAPRRPTLEAKTSAVSMLSSEEGDGSDVETATEADSVAEVKCKRCGSVSFKAKVFKGQGHKLVCQRCGLVGDKV